MSLNFFNEPCQWSMISSLMCLEGPTIRKGSSTNWTFLPGYQPNYYIFKRLLDKYWQILVSWYLLQNASRQFSYHLLTNTIFKESFSKYDLFHFENFANFNITPSINTWQQFKAIIHDTLPFLCRWLHRCWMADVIWWMNMSEQVLL